MEELAHQGLTFDVLTLAEHDVVDDDGAAQLATVGGDVSSGYRVCLTFGVDTATTPASGGSGGRPGRR